MTVGPDVRKRAKPAASPTFRYRPALDGIRGVAIAAVVLYHCGVSWVPGGFLGVDVFFVLSGFLITGLLMNEWMTWGSIDLRAFWARRARRLLPALFVLLVVVSLVAGLGPSDERGRLRGDLVATLLYVANWHSVIAHNSYFDQFTAPSPLLHTWSLAIEEQWYLAFPPLLIFALHRFHVSRGTSRRALRPIIWSLLILATLSAALMWRLADPVDPSRAYYGTDTRIQALLIGAALAIATRSGTNRRSRHRVRALGVPAFLALAIAFMAVPDNAQWMYRGGFLLVAAATAVVVLDSCRPDSITHRILATEPLRRLGVISYGLYLWHWPVIVYLDGSRTHLQGLPLLVVRVATMVALAVISYRLVELPIRSGSLRRRLGRTGSVRVASLATACVVAAVLVGTAGATPSTADQFRTGIPASARSGGEPLVFMVGDSVPFGLALYFPSDAGLGFAVQDSTYLGCGLIPARTFAEGNPQTLLSQCRTWSDSWPAQAKAAHPRLGAVFVGEGELFDQEDGGRVLRFASRAFEAHLDRWLTRSVNALRAASDSRVALVTVPCHAVMGGQLGDIVNDTSRITWLNAAIYRYAASHPSTTAVIDLNAHLCKGGYTNSLDGVDLRTDGVHFSRAGARVVWEWLGPQLRAMFK